MTTDFTTRFQTLLTVIQTKLLPFMTFTQGGAGALSAGAEFDGDLVYDDDGLLVSRSFERDDGLFQEDSFVDGVRSTTRLVDVADEFVWADVTNVYDETGRIRKETTFDDGLLRVDTFQDGVRLRAYQTDPDDVDLMDWTTRDVTYDYDGTPLSRLTRYDDGTERLETFQDGTRSSVVQEDLVLTAQDWSQVASIYDLIGRLIGRDITYDSGIEREDTFSAGVRRKAFLEDAEGQFDWDAIQYLYDPDGVVTSRQQLDDDGDLTLILFEDGQRVERVIVDVSDDEDWEVQITSYDETGVSDVAEYVERGTVLDDYAPFFAVDEFVLA